MYYLYVISILCTNPLNHHPSNPRILPQQSNFAQSKSAQSHLNGSPSSKICVLTRSKAKLEARVTYNLFVPIEARHSALKLNEE